MSDNIKPGDMVFGQSFRPVYATQENMAAFDDVPAYDPDKLAELAGLVPTGEITQGVVTAVRLSRVYGPMASMIRYRYPETSGQVTVREIFRMDLIHPGLRRIIVDVGTHEVRRFEYRAEMESSFRPTPELDVGSLIGHGMNEEMAQPNALYREFFEWLWDMLVVMGQV